MVFWSQSSLIDNQAKHNVLTAKKKTVHPQGYFKHQNNKPSIETVLDFSKEFKLRQKNQSHTEKKKKIFNKRRHKNNFRFK